MGAAVAQTQTQEFASVLVVDLEEFLGLLGLECVLVDCDWEVEVIVEEDSRKDLENIYGESILFPLLYLLLAIFVLLLLCWFFLAGLIGMA